MSYGPRRALGLKVEAAKSHHTVPLPSSLVPLVSLGTKASRYNIKHIYVLIVSTECNVGAFPFPRGLFSHFTSVFVPDVDLLSRGVRKYLSTS